MQTTFAIVLDIVRVISAYANLKKDNWTIGNLERLLAYMKGEI